MRTHVCRTYLCLALCICLCLSPCIRLLLPASAGSAAEDGTDKSFPEGTGKGFPDVTDTTVCTLTAGYALPNNDPNSAPNNGEESGVCIDVPVYLKGAWAWPLAGILFTVGLPTPWHLSGIRPGAGAGGLTLTVRAAAGESGTEAAERYAVLLDGHGDSTPDATAQDRELIILTLTYQAVPEDTVHGTEKKSLLTLTPVVGDDYVYMWTDSGGLVTLPLRGSQTPLPSPGACEYGSEPATEPATEDNTGTDTEEESKTETGINIGTEADPVSGYPSDGACRFRYVGCQEARYGDGLLSVRFLYLVPDTGKSVASPSVWLTGGGTATLTVSCVSSVAVWGGPSDCHEVTAPPGTRYLMLTYTGLDAGRTYLFTLDTGRGLAHEVYEQGTYKGRPENRSYA